MRISDWSSDVCSSDLRIDRCGAQVVACAVAQHVFAACGKTRRQCPLQDQSDGEQQPCDTYRLHARTLRRSQKLAARNANPTRTNAMPRTTNEPSPPKKRSSTRARQRPRLKHQSLMRMKKDVFCLQ